MSLWTRQVESNISETLRNKSHPIFTGQSTPEEHYVGILASFPTKNAKGFSAVCLAFSHLENEVKQDEDEHISFMEFVFGVFEMCLDKVVALFEIIVPQTELLPKNQGTTHRLIKSSLSVGS